jgi:hypothetical protein
VWLHHTRNDTKIDAIKRRQWLFLAVRKSTGFLMFSAAAGLFWWIFKFHVDVFYPCFEEFFAEWLEIHFLENYVTL